MKKLLHVEQKESDIEIIVEYTKSISSCLVTYNKHIQKKVL
ncbi:MAG: hypothetical protein WBP43_10775 [Chitinophagales bacterium]